MNKLFILFVSVFLLSAFNLQEENKMIGNWVISSAVVKGKKHIYRPKPQIVFSSDGTAILNIPKKDTQNWNWAMNEENLSLKIVEKEKDPFFLQSSFSVSIQDLKNRKEMQLRAKGIVYTLKKAKNKLD